MLNKEDIQKIENRASLALLNATTCTNVDEIVEYCIMISSITMLNYTDVKEYIMERRLEHARNR